MSNVRNLFGPRITGETGVVALMCNERLDDSLETARQALQIGSDEMARRSIALRFLPSPSDVLADDGAIYAYRRDPAEKSRTEVVVSDGARRFFRVNHDSRPEADRLMALYATAYGIGVLIGKSQRSGVRTNGHMEELWQKMRIDTPAQAQPYRFAAAIVNHESGKVLNHTNIVWGSDRRFTTHAASFVNPLSLRQARIAAAALFKPV